MGWSLPSSLVDEPRVDSRRLITHDARARTPHHLEDHSGHRGSPRIARLRDDLRMMNENSVTPSLDGYDVFRDSRIEERVYDKEVEQAWFGREIELIAEADGATSRSSGSVSGLRRFASYHGGIVERSNEPEIGWYDVEAHKRLGYRDWSIGLNSILITACCPRAPNCGPRRRARCRPFVWDETSACSFIPRLITSNSRTGSPVESKRPATSVSTWARWSSRRNSKRPRRANARPTSLNLFLAHIQD